MDLKKRERPTAKRTSILRKIDFVGGEWYPVVEYKDNRQTRARLISGLTWPATSPRTPANAWDDLNDGTKAIDQLSIFVSIVFERRFSVLKQPEDVLGGVACPEFCWQKNAS